MRKSLKKNVKKWSLSIVRMQFNADPHMDTHAHRPRRAISPAPASIQQHAYANLPLLASRIPGLNKNSCAINSTKPVYINTPALNESMMPETAEALAEFGLYVVRTPRPAAIPMGVVKP